MSKQQLLWGGLLASLLLISIMGNVGLFLWARAEARQAELYRTKIESLEQDIETLREEIKTLRAQSRLQETMTTIAAETQGLRELAPIAEVNRQLVERTEMQQVLAGIIADEYPPEEARKNEVVLTTLELIPPDTDLLQTFTALLDEQVAGLYHPDAQTLYVVKYSRGMGALEAVTFAHEYTHALQDQHFDLTALGLGSAETFYNDDELVAIQALVEGDATLSMQQYMQTHFTALDMLSLLGAALTMDQEALNQAPVYLRQSMMFPYQNGLIFATYLYQRDGWTAINEAYSDPPRSSEQILHPYRYPDDTPQIVSLPPLTSTLDGDWQLVYQNVLGELGLRLYLDTHLTRQKADDAAAGWGGDRYAVYQNPTTGDVILALALAWDNEDEQLEFTEFYQTYAQQRFGDNLPQHDEPGQTWWQGSDVLLLTHVPDHPDQTLIVLAPDKPTTERIVTAFEDF